jgi:uncharacterized protein
MVAITRKAFVTSLLLVSSVLYAQLPANDRLFSAIAAEDITALSAAIHDGASLASHDRYGHTPLTAAAAQGNEHVVEALLTAGADANAHDGNGFTPLIVASQRNQIDVAQNLLAHHAGNDVTDGVGRSAIFYAIRRDHQMLKLLLSAHPNLRIADRDGYSVLEEAYSVNDYDQVQLLRQAGASFVSPFEELFAASATGDVARINALLALGVNVNAAPPGAMTPLMIAAWRGNTAAVRVLLAKGADPNVFDRNLQNALFWAFTSKHLSTVEAMLDASPDLKLSLNGNRSALHLAVMYFDEVPLIHRLLAEGTPIDGTDFAGNTPLMLAAESDHRRSAIALLQAHADIAVRNKQGLNAADLAAKHRDRALAVKLEPTQTETQ